MFPSDNADLRRQTPAAPAPLDARTILCVGGRSGNVLSYRGMIERMRARFAHHDGFHERRADLLDASLAAADLVICQTGGISDGLPDGLKSCNNKIEAPDFQGLFVFLLGAPYFDMAHLCAARRDLRFIIRSGWLFGMI